MYHTSPQEITTGTINSYGVAGSCLFFSDNIYAMTQSDELYVYEADFNCLEAFELYDVEIIAEIEEKFNCSTEEAEGLLDASLSEWDYSSDADYSWWLQGKRGECAKKMGYDGCEDKDEQGTVYIIPMLGRESELKRVDNV